MDQLSQHLSFLPAWAVGPVIALLTIVIGYFISIVFKVKLKVAPEGALGCVEMMPP